LGGVMRLALNCHRPRGARPRRGGGILGGRAGTVQAARPGATCLVNRRFRWSFPRHFFTSIDRWTRPCAATVTKDTAEPWDEARPGSLFQYVRSGLLARRSQGTGTAGFRFGLIPGCSRRARNLVEG
jgi:hypothetical protein